MVFKGKWSDIPDDFKSPAVVVIGNFDGVHKGHQNLVKTCLEKASELGCEAVALTFYPHPMKVFDKYVQLLLPLNEKIRLLRLYGIQKIVVLEFEPSLYNLFPKDFVVEVLLKRLRARAVVVGENFRFGKGRCGDIHTFIEMGNKFGFEVCICSTVIVDGMPVSSTRIRRLLREGKVEDTWRLLGRPFKLVGKVIEGRKRGRKLGFPTANLDPQNEVIPKNGVYAGFADLGSSLRKCVINVGVKPTFCEKILTVEAYILDFHENLYGREIGLYFVKRLRDEKKFVNVEELKEAIEEDIKCSRELLDWDLLSVYS